MHGLTLEELDGQEVVELAPRESMQVVAIFSPITATSVAVAANVLSPFSLAAAAAVTTIG